MHQNTHYVHSFILQWDIPAFYAHLRFYICARACLLLRPNKITKKSFLLNDLHLRNRDKPLTILFLCYDFGFFIYLVKANCHVVVCELFLLFLFFRLSWSDEKGKIYMSIELYCNDLILLKTRRFQSKLISFAYKVKIHKVKCKAKDWNVNIYIK